MNTLQNVGVQPRRKEVKGRRRKRKVHNEKTKVNRRRRPKKTVKTVKKKKFKRKRPSALQRRDLNRHCQCCSKNIKIHSFSAQCLKSELDLFFASPTKTAIESDKYVRYSPVCSNLKSDSTTWKVASTPEEAVDLAHSSLLLDVCVRTGNSMPIQEVTRLLSR